RRRAARAPAARVHPARRRPPSPARILRVVEPVPYSAIVDRPPLRWPGGARVALWVSPNVELYELVPPANPYFTAWSRVPAPPDPLAHDYRDYGNRVCFWRLLEVLDAHGVRAT